MHTEAIITYSEINCNFEEKGVVLNHHYAVLYPKDEP